MDKGSLMYCKEADISGLRLRQVKKQIFLDRDSLRLRSRYFWTEAPSG